MRESLRFGFEREGVAVASCGLAEFEPELFAEPAELVIAGGRDREEARAVLSLVRGALAAAPGKPPVLYVGNGIARAQALAEGATEFLQPVFLRDAVTVARLLAGRKRDNPTVLTGDLVDHFGLFYLVRAISALGRRGVLTLVRGMRRGELRFFDGEVTSAQVGLLHGLAALHQLLLWTEGRFELRPEDVVRRRQIPLEPAELFADAERFLSEICAVAGPLVPTVRYERDDRQIARVQRIPSAVGAIVALFDGSRTVADVVEDSQYRVFETLRIANRLCELGMIRLRTPGERLDRTEPLRPRSSHVVVSKAGARVGLVPGGSGQAAGWVGCPPPKAQPKGAEPNANAAATRPPSASGVGAVSGSAPGAAASGSAVGAPAASGSAVAAPAAQPSGGSPVGSPSGSGRRERRRKRRRDRGRDRSAHPEVRREPTGSDGASDSAAGRLVVDWDQLLPDAFGADLGVSPVVPSSVAAGEISLAEPAGGRQIARAETAPEEPAQLGRAPVDAPARRVSTVRLETAPDEPAQLGRAPTDGGSAGRAPTEDPAARKLAARRSRAPSQPSTFSDSEEAFFAQGSEIVADADQTESFDDLDKDHLPRSFWRRLFRSPTARIDRGARPRRR